MMREKAISSAAEVSAGSEKPRRKPVVYVLRLLLLLLIALMLLTALAGHSGEGLSLAGYRLLVVRTSSMQPTIPAGSLILIGPASESLSAGEVITFREGGALLTHRVVETTPEGLYRTKGDAVDEADARPVHPEAILGSLRLSIPALGSLLAALPTPRGLIAVAVLMAALWLARLWLRRFLPHTTGKRETKTSEKGTE